MSLIYFLNFHSIKITIQIIKYAPLRIEKIKLKFSLISLSMKFNMLCIYINQVYGNMLISIYSKIDNNIN